MDASVVATAGASGRIRLHRDTRPWIVSSRWDRTAVSVTAITAHPDLCPALVSVLVPVCRGRLAEPAVHRVAEHVDAAQEVQVRAVQQHPGRVRALLPPRKCHIRGYHVVARPGDHGDRAGDLAAGLEPVTTLDLKVGAQHAGGQFGEV